MLVIFVYGGAYKHPFLCVGHVHKAYYNGLIWTIATPVIYYTK